MAFSLALGIALWSWLILCGAAVIASGAGWVLGVADDEWSVPAIALLPLVAGLGGVYLALAALGHAEIAIWIWRVVSGIGVLGGIVAFGLAIRDDADAGPLFSLAGATALTAALFVCSVLPLGSGPQVRLPDAAAATHVILIPQVSLWHNITLAVLGLGAVAFLLLFVSAVRRGIPPGIETFWGGFGGGLGGWRMSPSLTYLVGALVFAILFGALTMREENAWAAGRNGAPAPAAAATGGKAPAEAAK